MKTKKLIIVLLCVAGIVSVAIASAVNTKAESVATEQSKHKKFVKTNCRCDKCGCSGYWGYRHDNGTYEGGCQNTDGWGHRCGHSPEHHGLRSW